MNTTTTPAPADANAEERRKYRTMEEVLSANVEERRKYSQNKTVVYDPIDREDVIFDGSLSDLEAAITKSREFIIDGIEDGYLTAFTGVNDPDIEDEAVHQAL